MFYQDILYYSGVNMMFSLKLTLSLLTIKAAPNWDGFHFIMLSL
jgi:hypothetical protein